MTSVGDFQVPSSGSNTTISLQPHPDGSNVDSLGMVEPVEEDENSTQPLKVGESEDDWNDMGSTNIEHDSRVDNSRDMAQYGASPEKSRLVLVIDASWKVSLTTNDPDLFDRLSRKIDLKHRPRYDLVSSEKRRRLNRNTTLKLTCYPYFMPPRYTIEQSHDRDFDLSGDSWVLLNATQLHIRQSSSKNSGYRRAEKRRILETFGIWFGEAPKRPRVVRPQPKTISPSNSSGTPKATESSKQGRAKPQVEQPAKLADMIPKSTETPSSYLTSIPKAMESSAFGKGATSSVEQQTKHSETFDTFTEQLQACLLATPSSSSPATEKSASEVSSAAHTSEEGHIEEAIPCQNPSEPLQSQPNNAKLVAFVNGVLKFVVLAWFAWQFIDSLCQLFEEAFRT
jgi:hypothetical protein